MFLQFRFDLNVTGLLRYLGLKKGKYSPGDNFLFAKFPANCKKMLALLCHEISIYLSRKQEKGSLQTHEKMRNCILYTSKFNFATIFNVTVQQNNSARCYFI